MRDEAGLLPVAVELGERPRVGPAVATLSVFIGPMTTEFGWSRTEISGAVSLGGILAAITSPMLGTFLDRKGPRTILLIAVLTTGITILLLSQIGHPYDPVAANGAVGRNWTYQTYGASATG